MASLFPPPDDKLDRGAARLMSDLEKIDDDLDKNGIFMVKMAANDDKNKIDDLQINELPAIVFFDNKFPTTYTGKSVKLRAAPLDGAQTSIFVLSQRHLSGAESIKLVRSRAR